MEKQKRFKKQKLNSDADKGMEQGAKAVKGGLGLALAVGIVIKNKDNLKTLGKNALNIAKMVIRK